MLIVKVDNVDAEPLQTGLTSLANIGRVPPDAEHRALGAARPSEFRRQNQFVAAAVDRPADQFLVAADAVHVGRIEHRHAAIDGVMNGRNRFLVVAAGVKLRHAHATEPERGNLQARTSEFTHFHHMLHDQFGEKDHRPIKSSPST